jgi:Putative MetA-pathway of phenol degradation
MGTTRATGSRIRGLAALLALICVFSTRAHSQELEPRAYSPNPVDLNFVVAGVTHTTGDVLFDPSSPIQDVHATLNSAVTGYGHTFSLFGRSASAAFAIPYVQGDVSGSIGEAHRSISRSGLADPRLRLAVNLLGGEAMTLAEFARRRPDTTLGVSLVIAPPLGQYDPDKLINLGTNRWSFKPEIGLSQPIGKWFIEGYVGATLFTDNNDYYGGQHREQNAVWSYQGHTSYTFRPGLWLALDATYYTGGRTTIDGRPGSDMQSNARVGLTFSLPLVHHQSLKFAFSKGAVTRVGGAFTNYGIVWQYAWFD